MISVTIITSRSGGSVILGAVFRQALPVDAVRGCASSVSVARFFAAPSMTLPAGTALSATSGPARGADCGAAGSIRLYHSHHNKLLSQTASGSPSRFGCTYEPPAMNLHAYAWRDSASSACNDHPCGLKPSGSYPAQTLGKDIPNRQMDLAFGNRHAPLAVSAVDRTPNPDRQKLNEPASAKRRAGPKSVSSNHAPILIRKSAWIFNYFLTKHLYEELH